MLPTIEKIIISIHSIQRILFYFFFIFRCYWNHEEHGGNQINVDPGSGTRLDGTSYQKREIILADDVEPTEVVVLQVFDQDIKRVKFENGLVAKFKRIKMLGSGSNKILRFVKESEQYMGSETENIDNNNKAYVPPQSPNNDDIDAIDNALIDLNNNQQVKLQTKTSLNKVIEKLIDQMNDSLQIKIQNNGSDFIIEKHENKNVDAEVVKKEKEKEKKSKKATKRTAVDDETELPRLRTRH